MSDTTLGLRVLERRGDLVDRLFAEPVDDRVIVAAR
jgi:hypothetical protein